MFDPEEQQKLLRSLKSTILYLGIVVFLFVSGSYILNTPYPYVLTDPRVQEGMQNITALSKNLTSNVLTTHTSSETIKESLETLNQLEAKDAPTEEDAQRALSVVAKRLTQDEPEAVIKSSQGEPVQKSEPKGAEAASYIQELLDIDMQSLKGVPREDIRGIVEAKIREKAPGEVTFESYLRILTELANMALPLNTAEASTAASKAVSALPESAPLPTPPAVDAQSYIVANVITGEIYAEKNKDLVRPIASISKLVTALAANGSLSFNPLISVSKEASEAIGNSAHLKAGESVSLEDAFSALLLTSANDAASAIAEHYGEETFRALMNRNVKDLKMLNSTFVEPSGLSEHNTSTAYDLFLLTKYLYTNKKSILDITKEDQKTITKIHADGTKGVETHKNIHQLKHIDGFIGGKNGYTNAAGRTLLSLFEVRGEGEEKYPIVIIVLNSENVAGDSLSLLSWVRRAVR